VVDISTRTCVGCRERTSRELLVRLVRDARGVLEVDPHGGAPGRGAWVHDRRACVEAAISDERLARALRARPALTERLWDKLRAARGKELTDGTSESK